MSAGAFLLHGGSVFWMLTFQMYDACHHVLCFHRAVRSPSFRLLGNLDYVRGDWQTRFMLVVTMII